jgi:SecD/SecF fusion protein
MLTVGIMILVQAPLTLPGLAGLVLTVAMSVDANVLISERIREELARGAALRMAIRNGFDKALSAILDGNLTTFLTALVLYTIGTDQIRGFGMTLMLGNVTSMFTAIFCVRVILDVAERTRWIKTLSMANFLPSPRIDWVRFFVPGVIGSVVLIVIGMAVTAARGKGLFDIDLAGGTSVTFILKKPMPEDAVRKQLATAFAGLVDPTTKTRLDYNVYRMQVASESEGAVYKVDSSLPEVTDLQEKLRAAFRTEGGEEGLKTFNLTVGEIKETLTAPPEVAPSATPAAAPAVTPAPGPATPTEESKPVEPKPSEVKPAETPKPADAPKPADEKPAEPKPESPKPAERPAEKPEEKKPDEAKPESSECQEEPAEAKKIEDKPAAPEKPVTTEPPASAKPEEQPAAEAPKSTDKPTETPAATPPAATTPAPATTEPATTPEAPKPKAPRPHVTTEVVLKFPGSAISAQALKDRLAEAAKETVGELPSFYVRNDKWGGLDNSAFEEWTVEKLPLTKEETQKLLAAMEKRLENDVVWQSSSKIGGQVSVDTRYKATTALAVSLLGIVAYVWFRFQKVAWGLAAVAALAHDALVMLTAIAASYWLVPYLGFLGVEEFKISLSVVAAFLTILGYSVNDTIVIFDRLREIRGKSPTITRQMLNDAVNQTLGRTIILAGITLSTTVILYFFGGPGIHAFSFALVVGVISGCYTTLVIAAPLLLWLLGKTSSEPARSESREMARSA